MQTVELHIGVEGWQSVVRVDGEPLFVTLVELTIDPVTQRTGLRLETEAGTQVLTGTLVLQVETATPVEAGSDLTISEWQDVRRFAETHRHELLALARSMWANTEQIQQARLHFDRQYPGLAGVSS